MYRIICSLHRWLILSKNLLYCTSAGVLEPEKKSKLSPTIGSSVSGWEQS